MVPHSHLAVPERERSAQKPSLSADCKIPDNVGGDCGTVTSLSPESLPAFGGLTSSASAEGQMEPLCVRPALLS